MLAASLFPPVFPPVRVLPLVPCLCAVSCLLLPLGAVLGLPWCSGSCCAVSPCVGVCCVGLLVVVFCPLWCAVSWHPRDVVRWFSSCCVAACSGLACDPGCLLPPPPPAGCGALCCAVFYILWCGAVVCGVACFALCLVLCDVLVLGWVLSPCCPAWCCARSCCAVFVVIRCRVLLCSRVSFGVVPWLPVVLPAVSVCLVLCRGVCCCLAWLYRVVFVCWSRVRCAVWFVAVFLSCGASSAAVAGCCALSLGAVLCCPAVLPVVPGLSFLLPCVWSPSLGGASCAVLCWRACPVAFSVVLSGPSGAGWCFVLLPVAFWCSLLGLAARCCLLVAPGGAFWHCCPCLPAWLAAVWFVVVGLVAVLPCVVSSGAVLS